MVSIIVSVIIVIILLTVLIKIYKPCIDIVQSGNKSFKVLLWYDNPGNYYRRSYITLFTYNKDST